MGRMKTHSGRAAKASVLGAIANAGPLEAIPDLSLAALFSSVALDRGEATAIVGEGVTLSYAQLDAASNRLARFLIAKGATAETVIALALPRGPQMIVAMLAILKAGACYLPLDPHHPSQRLGFMIADARARLIVTRPDIAEALRAAGQALPPAIDPEGDGPAIAHLSDAPLAPHEVAPPQAESLAYVMYTSGSTGTPKGSGIIHGGIVNLAWRPSFADIGPDDTVLQSSNAAFDASTFEIWGALLNGARLLLAPEGPLDLERLAVLMADHRATIAFFTAGLFGEIALHHLPMIAGLRHLLSGGDILPVAAVARVRAAYPALRLTNVYGPTETTVITTTQDIAAGEAEQGPISIGRPIRNAAVHIFDEHGVPVRPGEAGELYISGAGVSRGYHARPDLHAERFLPCPYGPPGALMYRTGDLGRWRPDGKIDFLGRADGQIKLRGFRIELGEIEAALTRIPGVAQASVQARPVGEDVRLVAYLVPTPGATPPDAAELRTALGRTLTDYMIPQAFILLDKLPLTPNGKVDRRALPDPVQSASRQTFDSPRTPTEALLCRLFADLTGFAEPAREDDFFLIGGHSLLAMRLAAAIAGETGKALPLGEIFRLRTPAAIAPALDGISAMDPGPRKGIGWTDGAPTLSAGQRRHWLLDRLPGLASAYVIPLAFELTGPLDIGALGQALVDVVDRHLPLRTAIEDIDGLPTPRLICGLDAAELLALTDLSALAPDAQAQAIDDACAAACAQPFDLAADALLRAQLLRLGPDRSLLLLQLHHGAADGESLPPLFTDLALAYDARRKGATPAFPSLAYDHADYAAWHAAWLERSGEGERQSNYWQARLADFPGCATIAPDREPDPTAPRQAGSVSIVLPPDLTTALDREAARHGTTAFTLVLAAYAGLVGQLSGQRDLAIGVAVAGRQRPGLADHVGCFVNALPVRLDLGAIPTLAGRIDAVRTSLEATLSHADLPFERIVALSCSPRQAGRNPVFEAALSWQAHDPGALSLPGIDIAPRAVAPTHAKFDLALTVQPGAQGGLVAALDYDAGRFSHGRACDWAETLARSLADLARGAEGALAAPVTAPAAPDFAKRTAVTPAGDADPATLALVARLFGEVTGTADSGLDEDFFLLGGNSLSANRLIARIKAESGKRLLLEQFLQAPTIRGCAVALDGLDPQDVASSAVPLQPRGVGRPFFCVHGIEGNLLALRHLAEAFGVTRPFIGLRALPDDPIGQSIGTIAARYVAAIRAHQPHGPYLIGGYSLGGAIAFEIARQLRAAGESIALLAIIDARWPGWRLSWRTAPRAGLFWLANAHHILIDELRQLSPERIAAKGRNLVRTLIRAVRPRRSVALADIVDMRLVPTTEQARLQGHLDAMTAYRPAPCPVPIALFRARAPAALHAWGDGTYGWRATAEARVAVHVTPGNHISLVRDANAPRLAALLNRALDAADPPPRA